MRSPLAHGQRARPVRRAVVLAILGAVLLTLVVPATAQAASAWGWTYRSGEVCAYTNATVKPSGGVYRVEGTIQAWGRNYTVPPPLWDCKFPNTKPPGWLAAKVTLYGWDGYQWYVCKDYQWGYNDRTVFSLTLWADYGWPPCGAGYYGNITSGYVLYNGEWKGGWVYSGYECLGCVQSAEPEPTSLSELLSGDGKTQIPVASADGTPVLDKDGNPVTMSVAQLTAPPPPGAGINQPLPEELHLEQQLGPSSP